MKIYMIRTNKECFITDCEKMSGCDFEYHKSKIGKLIFDGNYAKETYCKNWYIIKEYPKVIERNTVNYINKRYEIINESMICDKFPKIIKYDDICNFDYDVSDFYIYKADKVDEVVVANDIEIEVMLELDNFEIPTIDFLAYGVRQSYGNSVEYSITNLDVKHQMIDKIMFPQIMLSSRPCSLSSKQMYDITRQYIRSNIDLSKAKITSDYDYCFEVKKIVQLLEPEIITYKNIFGKTKRERAKTQYIKSKHKEVTIFSMTHDQENYRSYPSIEPIYANNETELKEKVNTWLKYVIDEINKTLSVCECCNGTGYKEDIEVIDINNKM